MHKENVQIRGVVRNDHIWTFGQLAFLHFSYAIKAENTHHPTPENKDPKTLFLPGFIAKNNQHERIKKDRKDRKDDSHV